MLKCHSQAKTRILVLSTNVCILSSSEDCWLLGMSLKKVGQPFGIFHVDPLFSLFGAPLEMNLSAVVEVEPQRPQLVDQNNAMYGLIVQCHDKKDPTKKANASVNANANFFTSTAPLSDAVDLLSGPTGRRTEVSHRYLGSPFLVHCMYWQSS
jgi:hypothetical protein